MLTCRQSHLSAPQQQQREGVQLRIDPWRDEQKRHHENHRQLQQPLNFYHTVTCCTGPHTPRPSHHTLPQPDPCCRTARPRMWLTSPRTAHTLPLMLQRLPWPHSPLLLLHRPPLPAHHLPAGRTCLPGHRWTRSHPCQRHKPGCCCRSCHTEVASVAVCNQQLAPPPC